MEFGFISNGYFMVGVQPDELRAQFEEHKKHVKVKYLDKQEKLDRLVNALSDD